MYIFEFGEKHHGKNFIEVNEDLTDIEYGMKNPLNQMIADLADIKKQGKFVQIAISKQTDNPKDNIRITLSDFNMKMIQITSDLETKLKKIEGNYEDLCRYFCDNPKDTPSDKLFEKLLKVFTTCRNTKKEVEKQKELLIKAAAAAAKKK